MTSESSTSHSDIFAQIDDLGTMDWERARPHIQKILIRLACLAFQSGGDLLDVEEEWHSQFETEMRGELQDEASEAKARGRRAERKSEITAAPTVGRKPRSRQYFTEIRSNETRSSHDSARAGAAAPSTAKPQKRKKSPQNGLTPALAAILGAGSRLARSAAQEDELPQFWDE